MLRGIIFGGQISVVHVMNSQNIESLLTPLTSIADLA